MATLSITKDWADGEVLLEADLDQIKEDVETFLNVTGINDDNLQDAGITASAKLIDASIPTAKLANLSVTTAKIDDLGVTVGKIAADAVITSKILDANVTKAKLATAARNATAASKSSDDTLDLTENLIYVDSSSVVVTLTLPAVASSSGHEYTFVKTSSSNSVVIDGNSSETINGATTVTLYQIYETLKIWCNGSAWFIEARHIPGDSYQAVVVSAKMSGSLSLSTGVDTLMSFDSEDIDNHSAFNNSTYIFTVPAGCDGDYLITGSVRIAATAWSADEIAVLKVQKNSDSKINLGSEIAHVSENTQKSCSGSRVLPLVATDTLKFYAFQNSSSTGGVTNAPLENFMSIVRVR